MESFIIYHLSFIMKHYRAFPVMENGKWKMENVTDEVYA
jgi:hypothetical protein